MNRYYNLNEEPQYVLHFPGKFFKSVKTVFKPELSRKFTVDPRISILTTVNEPCYESANLVRQCKLNNINLITSDEAMKVPAGEWYQPNKIDYILECLDKTTTEFALIMDANDTYIVHDLDSSLIDKFISMNTPFCYNAEANMFPNIEIENFFKIREKLPFRKFLNGGVVFGYTEELKKFYQFCKKVRDSKISDIETTNRKEGSEQYFLRLGLTLYKNGEYLLKGLDYDRHLFSVVGRNYYNIYEDDYDNEKIYVGDSPMD